MGCENDKLDESSSTFLTIYSEMREIIFIPVVLLLIIINAVVNLSIPRNGETNESQEE